MCEGRICPVRGIVLDEENEDKPVVIKLDRKN